MFISKYRNKAIFRQIRSELGEVLRRPAGQKESPIEEGCLLPGHAHRVISVPPKYAVSQVIGYSKGKRAIHVARRNAEKKRNFVDQRFWARDYLLNVSFEKMV